MEPMIGREVCKQAELNNYITKIRKKRVVRRQQTLRVYMVRGEIWRLEEIEAERVRFGVSWLKVL